MRAPGTGLRWGAIAVVLVIVAGLLVWAASMPREPVVPTNPLRDPNPVEPAAREGGQRLYPPPAPESASSVEGRSADDDEPAQ